MAKEEKIIINHEKGVVSVNGELTLEENLLVAQLRNNGYTVKVKRKANNKIHKLEYYQERLTGTDLERFENIRKNEGFIKAAHWATGILNQKEAE